MAKKVVSGTEEVDEFFEKLDHVLKDGLATLREIILSTDKKITEHIKWNGPSFCYDGIDRITSNIHRDQIMLVLHRGEKVKDTTGFKFDGSERLGRLGGCRSRHSEIYSEQRSRSE